MVDPKWGDDEWWGRYLKEAIKAAERVDTELPADANIRGRASARAMRLLELFSEAERATEVRRG